MSGQPVGGAELVHSHPMMPPESLACSDRHAAYEDREGDDGCRVEINALGAHIAKRQQKRNSVRKYTHQPELQGAEHHRHHPKNNQNRQK